MDNKRPFIYVGIALLIGVIVMVWYFFFSTPNSAPSLSETNNPIARRVLPVGFQFLGLNDEEVATSTTEVTDPTKTAFFQVWNKPVAGMGFAEIEILREEIATTTQGSSTIEVKKTVRATTTVLRFVDSVTGYIYELNLNTGTTHQISNTIIPGIHEAYFFDKGNKIIIRYGDFEQEEVMGMIATLPKVLETGEAEPLREVTTLSGTVSSVAVNQQGTRVSYVVMTDNGSSVYSVTPTGTQLISSSPFREWVIAYGGDQLYATPKPSAYVIGSTLKLPSMSLTTVDKTGLMSLPQNTMRTFNSMWSKSGLVTFISDESGDRTLSVATLASKCTWVDGLLICGVPRTLPKGSEGLPDDWFQGRVSFMDDLYIVDPDTDEATMMYSFTEGIFDISSIVVDGSKSLFGIVNKKGGTLWLLNTNYLENE